MRRPVSSRGGGQQASYVVVARLLEISIVESDGMKRFGRSDADNAIDHASQARAGAGRGHRYARDDRRRIAFSQRGRGRAHCCAGGEPVVHDDHDLAGEVGVGRVAIGALAPAQLDDLAPHDVLERGFVDTERCDEILVNDARSVACERAHRQLLVTRNAELADDVEVERHPNPPRDFVADRHASARQRQHDGLRIVRVVGEPLGELPPSVGTVGEDLHLTRYPLSIRGHRRCAR